MFFWDYVSPHKHLLFNVAAVFTLGKLMNVKEDYGELSSIARSVHAIDKSILFLFLRYCQDWSLAYPNLLGTKGYVVVVVVVVVVYCQDCTQFANLCANNS
jgi:hypothetical protein